MKQHIENLINFEINKDVIEKRDYNYVKNKLYELLNLSIDYSDKFTPKKIECPADALDPILDILVKNKTIESNISSRDYFDTKIMNIFVSLPSVINQKFDSLYFLDNRYATNWFYDYSKNTNYIRTNRILKNKYFKENSKYGNLEITINLSKPEKDPREIALALKNHNSIYPACVLCAENEGFAGDFKFEARDNHRIVEIKIKDIPWYFQFSPYTYYNEHAIVFSKDHVPMKISKITFENLLDLVDKFKNYFFGSNADIPIVGGSILSHEHYQGGKHNFPIENAAVIYSCRVDEVEIRILKWPLSTIRLISEDDKKIVFWAEKFLNAWKNYNNDTLNIKAYTNNISHHSITPIARMKNYNYHLDLILRDNNTNDDFPLGIFHPHADKWHIKRENIGLIEAMGLAVLPGRLEHEIAEIKNFVLNNITLDENLNKHLTWVNSWKNDATNDNFDDLIKKELIKKFEAILEDCGVFKQDKNGIAEFKKFVIGVIENEK